jgi:uncharacterized protein YcfJ
VRILKTGMSTMLGKMMIGLAAIAIVSVPITMSASAQQKSAKKVRVTIPKEVCETVAVSTQNWGQQTVQVCGPPGGPRGQAKIKQHK